MSDQQGWTAPGASTPPGDATGDATGAARGDTSRDTSGDAVPDALGDVSDASDGSAGDPTSDAGWGPPAGAAPTGPVPQSDAPGTSGSAYPPPAWWGQQPTAGPAPVPPADASHPAPGGAYPPPGGVGTPPPGPAYPPPSGTPLPQASGPGRPAPVQPPGWVPPQLAPKPGIIPLRPLNLGEIWGGVMTAVRGNPAATIGLALVTTAVVLVPLTLLGIWIASTVTARTASFDSSFDPAFGGYADSSGSTSAFLGGTLASLVPQLAMYATALLLPLFMAVVIGQGVQGRRIGLGETVRAARGRILPALGVVLLIGLAAFLALGALVGIVVATWIGSGDGGGGTAAFVTFLVFVAFVVLFVFFSVRWGFAMTIVVLEGAGPTLALRRSWTLTRKRGFWRIFGIRLLTGIVAAIAGAVITAPLGFLVGFMTSDSPTSTAWVLVLVQAGTVLVQSVLTTPFTAGVDSLLYVDQRIRYEGLDVALLQQSQQGRDAQVP
ncbi:glycerophosphoryl diester phosphodiesterase membrane domain-containing protein [Intrasporangium sp. YIM S08009]|uniref:glycerophosphoryl diester phosphodiesterase membrane domain-containing protein n=1 Tax=Intrasporangium zincisolvens TaxID=3080018 RepID=UPI002B0623D5|nr:glycerophosphoryl diester phosphodiesterase membrane domain-containing protein [Intrasporangium sp. YIM S08009]